MVIWSETVTSRSADSLLLWLWLTKQMPNVLEWIFDRQFKNQPITLSRPKVWLTKQTSNGDKPAPLWWRRSHSGVTLVQWQRTDISQSPGQSSCRQLLAAAGEKYQKGLCSQQRCHVCGGLQGAGWQNCSWQPCSRWHQVCQFKQSVKPHHWLIYQSGEHYQSTMFEASWPIFHQGGGHWKWKHNCLRCQTACWEG